MVTRATSLYKIPFKQCQDAVIQDERATIQLHVEWPQKGGDDPVLVLNIADNKPSMCTGHDHISPPHIHHLPPLSQQQENFHLIYLPQQYQRPHDASTIMMSGGHNDGSSTTATDSSSAAIQKIKNHLMSDLSSTPETSQTNISQYSTFEDTISTPASNTTDSFSDIQSLTIGPSIPNTQDPQQLSPSSNKPAAKPVLCNCSNPTTHHDYNCSVLTVAPRPIALSFTSNDSCSNANNRTLTSAMSHQTQNYLNDAHSIPSAQATTSVSFSNSNYMPTSVSSASLMTSTIQQSPFSVNNSIRSAKKTSPMIANNQHQPQTFVFPPASSMNYPLSTLTQGSMSSPRKFPTNGSCQQNTQQIEQSSLSNLNSCQTPKQVINRINSPPQQHQGHGVSAMISPSVHQQQRCFSHQNTFEMSNSSSLTHSQPMLMNDFRENLPQQHSSSIDQTVRSPVNLDSTLMVNSGQTSTSPPDIDRAINGFSQGNGTLVVNNMSNQRNVCRPEPLASSQHVWAQSNAVATTTYLSPLEPQQTSLPCNLNSFTWTHSNGMSVMPHIVRQSMVDYNTQIVLQQQSITKTKKRIRTKQTNETGTKRGRKTNASKLQLPTTSPPVTSTSTESVLTTQQSSTDTQQTTTDVDPMKSSEQIIQLNCEMDFELQDDGSPKTGGCLTPLTSPLSIQTPTYSSTTMPEFIANPITASVSADNALTTDSSIVYENFLSTPAPLPSSTWQENQVTSSVVTPPDTSNTCAAEYQQFSQVSDHGKSSEHTQMSSSQSLDNTSHLVKTCKDDRHVHRTVKSISKTSRKINPIRKYTSKHFKQQRNLRSPNGKLRCTRCNSDRITDITHHEFPGQKNLVFECQSCGNASLRSNVSADERKRRLSKVAADHLNRVECQFCHRIFHSHNDYLMHLKNDHASDK